MLRECYTLKEKQDEYEIVSAVHLCVCACGVSHRALHSSITFRILVYRATYKTGHPGFACFRCLPSEVIALIIIATRVRPSLSVLLSTVKADRSTKNGIVTVYCHAQNKTGTSPNRSVRPTENGWEAENTPTVGMWWFGRSRDRNLAMSKSTLLTPNPIRRLPVLLTPETTQRT